jgi:sigma54-dependent transcription regulator
LFGHEKGAFTGAIQRRVGRFELAEGGTIFLDQVGELLPDTEVALLRWLQEREFERIVESRPIHMNVRVIAATNRDLEAAVARGTFREDLYYRLNVFHLEMPSLRERREDIPLLVEYFIDRYAHKSGKNTRTVDKNTLSEGATNERAALSLQESFAAFAAAGCRIGRPIMAGTPNEESPSGIGFRTSANGTRTPEPRLGSVRFSSKRSPAGYSQSFSFSVTAHLVDGA